MIEITDTNKHPLGNVVRDYQKPLNTAVGESSAAQSIKSNKVSNRPLITLTPANLQAPAFLLDSNLEIVWQNQGAEDEIFQAIWDDPKEVPTLNIFAWLCGERFKGRVMNWRQ